MTIQSLLMNANFNGRLGAHIWPVITTMCQQGGVEGVEGVEENIKIQHLGIS